MYEEAFSVVPYLYLLRQTQFASQCLETAQLGLRPHPSCLAAKGVIGRCRGAVPRWSFDATSGACEMFMWGGCGEDSNNYESEELCVYTCGASRDVLY